MGVLCVCVCVAVKKYLHITDHHGIGLLWSWFNSEMFGLSSAALKVLVLSYASIMGCYTSKQVKTPGYEEPTVLAAETPCELLKN